jgi:hypothetical protein
MHEETLASWQATIRSARNPITDLFEHSWQSLFSPYLRPKDPIHVRRIQCPCFAPKQKLLFQAIPAIWP